MLQGTKLLKKAIIYLHKNFRKEVKKKNLLKKTNKQQQQQQRN